MGLDEERRLVFEGLERQLGTEFARAMMRMVPPMDWEELATKRDLERFATKEDLERFATKEDFERFATKEDFAEVKGQLAVIDERFETMRMHIDQSKHEVVAVMRGELVTAVVGQTRQMIFAMTGAMVAIGGLAVALARFV